VLPEVTQLLCCLCLPLLCRVMLLYHFPNPAGAVESLKEVIVSLVLQLLPVEGSLPEVRQPRDLGVGRIGHVAREIIDLEHEIRMVLTGELLSGDPHGFLLRSDKSIGKEFPAEV